MNNENSPGEPERFNLDPVMIIMGSKDKLGFYGK